MQSQLELSTLIRLLVWDYERGSLAYDLVCLLLMLLVFVLPPEWLRDPLVIGP
ncbi:MAG: hypothetical protein JXO72_01015 [Vicinamibacteria bacterium]|nr:hypothetical protein [Vicinamibacteria bacterium]